MFGCSPLGCIVHRSCSGCYMIVFVGRCDDDELHAVSSATSTHQSIHPATTLPRSTHSSAVAALLLVAGLPLLDRAVIRWPGRSVSYFKRSLLRHSLKVKSASHPNIPSTRLHLQGDNANHQGCIKYTVYTYLVWIILYSPDMSE